MLEKRVIPCLQLLNESLVKTINFKKCNYIGDPINTVRIFNELEVDELCFLDIRATMEKRDPNLKVLKEIANECFMPLSFGGGINSLNIAKQILSIGFEKIIINSAIQINPNIISDIANDTGSQSVIASIDIKKSTFGKYNCYSKSGTSKINTNPVNWAIELQNRGAGELLITSINNDGTWKGFDIEIIKKIAQSVSIPVIINGGCSSINEINNVFINTNISAVGVGSLFVFQQKDLGVLINYPDNSVFNKS
jgi:cyclase